MVRTLVLAQPLRDWNKLTLPQIPFSIDSHGIEFVFYQNLHQKLCFSCDLRVEGVQLSETHPAEEMLCGPACEKQVLMPPTPLGGSYVTSL